jgi:hypothetical protein
LGAHIGLRREKWVEEGRETPNKRCGREEMREER